jgi:hypothetical protein
LTTSTVLNKISAGLDSSTSSYKRDFKRQLVQSIHVGMQLEGYANGGHLALKVLDYQEELKKVVVTAFAEALAGAAKLKEKDDCLAWANAGGCIYHPKHPHTKLPKCGGQDNIAEFECSAGAVSFGLIQEIDAIATASAPPMKIFAVLIMKLTFLISCHCLSNFNGTFLLQRGWGSAGAKATAWTCGKSVSIIDLELTASALAEATAVAISYAYAKCEVDGGFACAHAATKIKETAYAVAKAYATLWAKSIRCKRKCKVEVDVVVEAVGSILVKAASKALAAGCSSASLSANATGTYSPLEPVLCVRHHRIQRLSL